MPWEIYTFICHNNLTYHIEMNTKQARGWRNANFSLTHWTGFTRGRYLNCKVERICRSPNLFAPFWGKKVGHRQTTKTDRAISMNFLLSSTLKKSTPGSQSCLYFSSRLIGRLEWEGCTALKIYVCVFNCFLLFGNILNPGRSLSSWG